MPMAPYAKTWFPGVPATLTAALAGWVLGTALQLQQSALWHWGVYASFGLVVLVIYAQLARKNIANVRRQSMAFLLFAIAAGGLTGLRSTLFLSNELNPALEGRDVLVQGVVTGLPQRNESGLRFRLDVESAQLDGQAVAIPPKVDVGWYGGVYPTGSELVGLQRQPGDVQAGERWTMTLRLKAPHGSRNPHGFDYELWLWEQGVQATGYVRAGSKDPPPQRVGQTWLHPVALARQSLRERIFARVEQRQAAGLIAALVLGDQNAIERVEWDVFRATGVAHLMSISGLHITMFAWGASMLVAWLWRRSGRLCLVLPAPTAALAGGVLLATAYAVFSGWGVPAQRTCTMLATIAMLRLLGARWPWPLVWLLACAVVVAADPWALLQPGFWLSFVAVGILFATDSGAGRADSTGAAADLRAQSFAGPSQGRLAPLGGSVLRIAKSVGATFREQWMITVALAPLTLLLFGQVSVVGLVANALAIPWVTLVVTPLAMLGALVPAVWDMAVLAVGWLMAWLQWLAAVPWAAVSMAVPPVWAGALGLLGAVVLVMPLPWSLRAMAIPLLLPVMLWRPDAPADGEFAMLAMDIGQGNAVLVRTANHALLYDAGPRYSLESDAGHRVVVPLLKALDVQLDRVVLSHRDTDHVGGAAAVLAIQPQADLLSSIEEGHSLQSLRVTQRCVAGQRWEWDGVQFEVLHPQTLDYAASLRPNALSCVLRIANARQSALLVGDIEQPQEAQLVAQSAPLKSSVLLVPHHGSKTSSSAAFLDAVQPDVALVQSGYRNRFGHPVASVMERYRERNIVVHDSPHCGAMAWRSDLPTAVACTRMERRHYWSHRVP